MGINSPEIIRRKIINSYQREIDPLVGAGELRDQLIGKLEGVLHSVPPYKEFSIDDISNVPIDYDSFPCSPILRTRIKNFLQIHSQINTYGDLSKLNEGQLAKMYGMGRKSVEIIIRHLRDKGISLKS